MSTNDFGPRSPSSRRTFLGQLSAAAVLGAVAPLGRGQAAPAQDPASTTLVGANVYVWTQYAQRENRKFDMGEVLSALRDTGYDYLEASLNVAEPEENGKLAEQFKAKGLRPVSIYTGGHLHEAGKADEAVARILAAAKVCAQAGFVAVSCNPDPIGREKTDEELKTQAAALDALGAGLNALGLRLGVHNHTPEMAHQAREFHYNFRHTNPARVGFCFDVHWVWRGGVMPLDALKEYGDRVVTWHLRQSRGGVWWEDLDTGDIDYAAVARYAREHRLARRFIVELAIENGTQLTRSGVENHRRSREFVRRVFEAA